MSSTEETIALKMALKDDLSGGLGSIKDKLGDIVKGFVTFEVGRRVLTNIIGDTAALQGQMIDLREAVKRTGAEWSTAKVGIAEFTKKMEDQKGVIDDYTRGALQRAIDFTHDLGKAQDVVSLAADIAAAKHVDLETATNAVGAAYTGNIRGLVGLAKEMKGVITESSTFVGIQKALAYYNGAAAANTEKLTTKWEFLKEAIEDVNLELGKRLGAGEDEEVGLWGKALEGLTFVIKAVAETLKDLRKANGDSNKVTWDSYNAAIRYQQGLGLVATGTKMLSSHQVEAEDTSRKLAKEVKILADNYGGAADELNRYLQAQFDSEMGDKKAKLDQESQLDKMSPGVPDLEADVDKSQDRSIKERERKITSSNRWLLQSVKTTNDAIKREAMAAFAVAVPAALSGGVQQMLGQWRWLNEETNGVLKKMAQDFIRYFVNSILESMAKLVVPGILGFLGSLFDTPANDRMAARQGADFARHFSNGVMAGMSGLGPNMAGSLAMPSSQPYIAQASRPNAGFGGGNITINISGNMTPDFIQKNIVDTIQRAANYGFGGFKYDAGFTTGNSVTAFN